MAVFQGGGRLFIEPYRGCPAMNIAPDAQRRRENMLRDLRAQSWEDKNYDALF